MMVLTDEATSLLNLIILYFKKKNHRCRPALSEGLVRVYYS